MVKWIGGEEYVSERFRVGDVGFLIETSHAVNGWSKWDLREHPASTNQSHEPRLDGWCGTTNDVAVYGRGMACVTKVALNGRARVITLQGEELRAALETLGYPELMP